MARPLLMIMTALQILFSMIRYVIETIHSISIFFSDSENEPTDPNSIYDEPSSSMNL